jgi:ATP/maltotriose-dependent transcriptional regulator MalT
VAASPVAVACQLNPLAVLHAMRGELELADELVAEASETLHRLGTLGSNVSHLEAFVRMLAGQPERAEQALRGDAERLESMNATGLLATTKAMLAQAVYAQDRFAEAGELCLAAAADAAPDDIVTQVIWRSVQAKVLAGGGRCEEGETLARAAIALVEPTDLLSHRADALLDLAEVLRARDRAAEAEQTVGTALALYERKGNAAFATVARSLLAA